MRITYLDHSGFAVEQGKTLLVFDEYNPRPVLGAQGLAGGVVAEADLKAHEKSVLLLSHSHSDHYCPEVLQLPFDQVLVSDDFPASVRARRVCEGEQVETCGLTVRVFGSTDLGVSYLVDVEGKRIFHAGDFNLWHWEDESTAQEIEEATAAFERVMRTLEPYAGTLDAAFFPLDPRMGAQTARGIQIFASAMRPRVLIPMHFQGDAALVQKFAQACSCVRPLLRRGQTLEI